MLVLEDVDVATSNLSEIRRALRIAASARQLCDTIVVAETGGGAASAVVVYDNGSWVERYDRFAV